MGIVIGIVIDVAVTAAATAAQAAAEAAAAAFADAVAQAATEAAAEAAANAAADAAADATADVEVEGAAVKAAKSEAESAAKGLGEVASIAEKVFRGIVKLSKLIKEYFIIDTVFKTAMAIMSDIEGSSQRVKNLEKYIDVLIKMGKEMDNIRQWLENHKRDTVKLVGINVPVDSGVLSEFMSPLAAGVGKLKNLSISVENQNKDNKAMTEIQLEAMKRCLVNVNTTFKSLTMFMDEKKRLVQVLSSFPISMDKVKKWSSELGM